MASMLITVFTLVVAIYFYRFFFIDQQRPAEQLPSSIITDMNLIKTDQTGRMVYHFFSDKAYHYMNQNRTEFTAPRGYYYTKYQPRWQSSAEHGQTLNGDNIVHLRGHVYIHQDAGKNNQAVTLTTSKATLYPEKQIAENKVFVKVAQPGTIVKSVGFHANMQQGKIVLLSKVHGYFVANNKQQATTSR